MENIVYLTNSLEVSIPFGGVFIIPHSVKRAGQHFLSLRAYINSFPALGYPWACKVALAFLVYSRYSYSLWNMEMMQWWLASAHWCIGRFFFLYMKMNSSDSLVWNGQCFLELAICPEVSGKHALISGRGQFIFWLPQEEMLNQCLCSSKIREGEWIQGNANECGHIFSPLMSSDLAIASLLSLRISGFFLAFEGIISI